MPHRAHGLTLTETLTALAMLAIGVLCIATVYLERGSAAPALLLHSKASRLAAEMAELVNTPHTAGAQFENAIGVRCQTSVPEAQRKQNAVACWQEKVARTLPNGNGALAFSGEQGPSAYLVTVSWSAPKVGTASYVLRVPVKTAATALAEARAAN